MNDVYFKNNNQEYNDNINNNIKPINKNSCYVPYADYYPMEYPEYTPPSFPSFQNQNTSYNNQTQSTKETKENKILKIETDSDIIQDLTGNYLQENNERTSSDDKNGKKEIEINLGQIIVNNYKLNDFPIININNINKYNLLIPEIILNKGEYFTAIKEKIEDKKDNENKVDNEMNEIIMEEEEENDNKDKDKDKILIPDKFFINMDENIKNALKQIMDKVEINTCSKNQILIAYKLVEILYNKCINIILDIKKNIKHKAKKEKNIYLSNQLLNIIKFHNELRESFLSLQNKNDTNSNANSISEINENKKDNYITYAQFYLRNCGKVSKCEICGKTFINFQTLGGHMSQYHRNISDKYKKQNMIRKQREGQRKLLDYVKEQLFKKYNLDYRLLKKNDEKGKIKSFIKSHQKEYEVLRRKIYREKAIKDSE